MRPCFVRPCFRFVIPILLAVVCSPALGQEAGTPERFAPGVISTDADELTAAFSPDGATIAFVRRVDGGRFTIHLADCEAGTCSEPVAAPFSGAHHDQAPAFSPDGSRLWFQSRRPKGPGVTPDPEAPRDDDVWVVERRADGWGEPRLVGPPVSLEAPRDGEPFEGREMAPSVDAAGALYFWSNRPSDAHGASDLYRAEPDGEGGFLAPVNLGAPVNGPHYETHPWIAPDGSLLLFSCDGCPDAMGGSDLYVSRRVEAGWSEPVNLGPAVNSTAYDFGASITPDGRWLVFSSNRAEGGEESGPQNIYRIEVERVPALGVD